MDEKTRQVTRLWTQAQPKVSAFVTSVVRDFKDRDDLVQDIAVAVFESFDRYDSDKPFTSWAMGVARNQFRNYLKKHQKRHDLFDPETIDCLEDAFASTATEESEKMGYLQECLAKLDGRGKQLCELRYQDDLKPAAIGDLIDMPGTAVRKSLQRIRDQLRDCINRHVSNEGGAQ